jgi:hypothetical protein
MAGTGAGHDGGEKSVLHAGAYPDTQLRRAVKTVNATLGALRLEKHPDKTFIGRIERSFDFPGYHFSPAGLALAKQTITNFIEKASRLYEQEHSAGRAAAALEMYVRRWFNGPGMG